MDKDLRDLTIAIATCVANQENMAKNQEIHRKESAARHKTTEDKHEALKERQDKMSGGLRLLAWLGLPSTAGIAAFANDLFR